MIAERSFIIIAGESMSAATRTLTYKLKDSAGVATPVDLTGYAARSKIRSDFSAGGATLLDMTSANGKIVLGGVAGTIAFVLSEIETAALWADGLKPASLVGGRQAYSLGFWDLELVSPGGSPVKRLMQGPALIVPEATRS